MKKTDFKKEMKKRIFSYSKELAKELNFLAEGEFINHAGIPIILSSRVDKVQKMRKKAGDDLIIIGEKYPLNSMATRAMIYKETSYLLGLFSTYLNDIANSEIDQLCRSVKLITGINDEINFDIKTFAFYKGEKISKELEDYVFQIIRQINDLCNDSKENLNQKFNKLKEKIKIKSELDNIENFVHDFLRVYLSNTKESNWLINMLAIEKPEEIKKFITMEEVKLSKHFSLIQFVGIYIYRYCRLLNMGRDPIIKIEE